MECRFGIHVLANTDECLVERRQNRKKFDWDIFVMIATSAILVYDNGYLHEIIKRIYLYFCDNARD